MERIERNVIIDRNGCWVWQGSTAKPPNLPYGYIKIQGQVCKVHRISYILMIGEIPKGLNVLHDCDNASCCNPQHLFVGSQQNNIEDMVAKQRHNRGSQVGERHSGAKISEQQAKEILQRHANGASTSILIEEFGRNVVYNLLEGNSWKHLPRPEPLDILW